MLGIRTVYSVPVNQVFTANTILSPVGIIIPIAPLQTQKLTGWVPITTGATGGIKFQLNVPVGGSFYLFSSVIYDTVAETTVAGVLTAMAPVTSALANAGNHFFSFEAYIVNGSTAGQISLQCAQNTAANSTTVLKGGTVEVITL